MKIESLSAEKEGILQAAKMILLAARTAPKARGRDYLETFILTDKNKDKLAGEMQRYGEEIGAKYFVRDAQNVRCAQVIVMLGTKIKQLDLKGCRFCGFTDCNENRENNGICAFNTGDLGIAIGSAVSKAADFRIDNRIMFTAGKAAINLGLFNKDIKVAYGIPLSVSGKNPFFDRK